MATQGAARRALPVLRDPVVRRKQRVFRCHYICEECPNEWCDTLLCAGISWCPSCDLECEPNSTEEWEEETIEIADEESER